MLLLLLSAAWQDSSKWLSSKVAASSSISLAGAAVLSTIQMRSQAVQLSMYRYASGEQLRGAWLLESNSLHGTRVVPHYRIRESAPFTATASLAMLVLQSC